MRWVALGSSFAAGPGIAPLVDRGAMRSARNYAHLVAEALGAELTDVTSSGATTDHLLSTPQRVLSGPRPPQLDAVTPETTHVSVTIGGNDLNFVGALTIAATRQAASTWLGRARVPRRWHPSAAVGPVTDVQVAALVDAFVEIVRRVRLVAPNARVLLVDYLTLIGSDPTELLRLSSADAATLRTTEIQLCDAFAAGAERSGAELVAVSRSSRDHGYASPEPWVTGFSFGNPLRGAIPFHPTPPGMQHVAEAILGHLRR